MEYYEENNYYGEQAKEEEEVVLGFEPIEEYVKIDGIFGSKAESERLLYQFLSDWRASPKPLFRNKEFVTRYFHEKRHVEIIQGIQSRAFDDEIWLKYNGKERMKTVSVALILCLHLGVEPPDIEPKPKEHAVLECWIDPRSCNAIKAQKAIAHEVEQSYIRWQPRARYKNAVDPTIDELKALCLSMRRNAKDERILFHYNGHGVPRPTKSGEIWVFNKTFTQYIPVSICTLQTWLEFPCIYVWDVSSAGNIVDSFLNFADQHEKDWRHAFEEYREKHMAEMAHIPPNTPYIEQARRMRFSKPPNFKECIHLAACKGDQRLPVDPRLPADLFTSCLTSPIQTSIIWYLIKKGRRNDYPDDLLKRIPGSLTDRRTMLGELNWIFTAITDTIAWNSLSRDIFQKLFRQDLLLASLFRAFLLAEKVMGDFGCDVISYPALPSLVKHPLWDSWEHTLDQCLDDLDKLFFKHDHGETAAFVGDHNHVFLKTHALRKDYVDADAILDSIPRNNQHWFFLEQMQAFEVWLEYGHHNRFPPQQLPVVLQVLLSQAHRTRALELLARFLDLGQWAVGHALSVGIFPYILKLLQSAQRELKPWLSFIWAKILAVEPHCAEELFKDIGDDNVYNTSQRPHAPHLRLTYFLQIMNDPAVGIGHKVTPAYVVAMLFHGSNAYTSWFADAQDYLRRKFYVTLVTAELLADPDAREWHMLRLWTLVGLGKMWMHNDKARWQAIRMAAHQRIFEELHDPVPEVRCAAVYCLGNLLSNSACTDEHATVIAQECADTILHLCVYDGSVMVREQVLISLQYFVIDFENTLCKYFLALLHKLELNLEEELAIDDIEEFDESEDAAAMEILDSGEQNLWEEEHIKIMRREREKLKQIATQLGQNSQIANSPPVVRQDQMLASTSTSNMHAESPLRPPKKQLLPQKDPLSVFSVLGKSRSQFGQQQEGARRPSGAYLASLTSTRKHYTKATPFDCIEEMAPLPKIAPRSQLYGPAALSARDSIFRKRTLKQIENLQRRTFKDPFERVWMGLLTLCMDPYEKIANMAQILVRHIEEASLELQHSSERRLATSASFHSFTVGTSSPRRKEENSDAMSARSDRSNRSSHSGADDSDLQRAMGEIALAESPKKMTQLQKLQEETLLNEPNSTGLDTFSSKKDSLNTSDVIALENAASTSSVPHTSMEKIIKQRETSLTSSEVFRSSKLETLAEELDKDTKTLKPSAVISPANVAATHDATGVRHTIGAPPPIVDSNNVPTIHTQEREPKVIAPGAQNEKPSVKQPLPPAQQLFAQVQERILASRASQEVDLSKPMNGFTPLVPPGGTIQAYTPSTPCSSKQNNDGHINSRVLITNNTTSVIASMMPSERVDDPPKFVVGSPSAATSPAPAPETPKSQQFFKPPLSTQPIHRLQRKFSQAVQPEHKLSDYDSNSIAAITHHFAVKRTLAGRIGGKEFHEPKKHPKADDPLPRHEPIISSEFVPWCSTIFANPVLHLVNGQGVPLDGVGGKMVCATNPGPYAYLTARHIAENARLEMDIVREGSRARIIGNRRVRQPVECNVQLLATQTEKRSCSVSFSMIRPCLYSTDGEFVSMFNYDSSKCHLDRRIHNLAGNDFIWDRSVWLESVNGMTHELLLVGSSNGLVRIWDPNYNEEGQNFLGNPFVVSTFYALASPLRHPLDFVEGKSLSALYNWDQHSGRLTVAGNAKVIRVWDAHCERTVLDVPLASKRIIPTALAGDFGKSHLYGVGFADGSIQLFDERLPVKENKILSLHELSGKIKGLSIRTSSERTILAAASSEGRICVWDPRMFKDPVVDIIDSVSNDPDSDVDQISYFNVHESGQVMVAVNAKPEIVLYDIGGMKMSKIQTNDIAGRPMTTPTAVSFHPMRPMVAVATADKYLCTYGLPTP